MSDTKLLTEQALLAGGCFWGVEELFRTFPGVLSTEVGYTGGKTLNPRYEEVKTGETGHAEAMLISFDPKKVSFEKILEFFFTMHDPTFLNRQGNDVGSQYRSEIFYFNDEQKVIAQRVMQKINESGFWPKPVVTQLSQAQKFYPAESYHQDYLQKNPGGYTCHWVRNSPNT